MGCVCKTESCKTESQCLHKHRTLSAVSLLSVCCLSAESACQCACQCVRDTSIASIFEYIYIKYLNILHVCIIHLSLCRCELHVCVRVRVHVLYICHIVCKVVSHCVKRCVGERRLCRRAKVKLCRRAKVTREVYVAVLHMYVAVLHMYVAVLHMYVAVPHMYVAVCTRAKVTREVR